MNLGRVAWGSGFGGTGLESLRFAFSTMQSSGFGAWGLGFGVWSLGLGVWGVGVGV